MTVRANRRRSGRRRGWFALLASALIAVAACGSSTPTPAPGASATPASNAEPTAAAGQSPAGPPPSPAPGASPPLSETLIAAALEAGTITYEQSLLYRALALFDSPGLPEEFRSPMSDMGAATALLKEVDQREAELSAGLLEKLAPYRVRPADPVSIFNQPPGQGSRGMVLALATPAPTWVSRPVDGTGARVWVKDSPFTDAQQERFAVIAARVWEQFPGVFRYGNPDEPGVPDLSVNPDGAIDIYFADVSALDPRRDSCAANPGDPNCVLSRKNGYTVDAAAFVGTTSSGYVVINAGLSDTQLPGTLAHELAHVSQNAYDRRESTWLNESTATWVSFRVLQKLDLPPAYAHAILAPFFAELDLPLAAPALHSRLHSYASWLFFLFASMEEGDAIVTSIWEKAAAEGVQSEKAVDQAFPFDQHFADFTVRNWNRYPVAPLYRDADPTFPGGLEPKIFGGGPTVMSGAGESLLAQSVRPLASVYYAYAFEDAVRKVTFENTFAGVAHAHVWAIKKIGDRWAEPEDWTGDAKREFCRDVADQNISELVLIVSNSDMHDELPAAEEPSRVVTKTTGCPAVTRASATYTMDSTGVDQRTWSRLSMVVVDPDGSGDAIATATVDYQHDWVEWSTSTHSESIRGSGTVEADIGCSINEDGTVKVEVMWTDSIESTRTRTFDGASESEKSVLEFNGFTFTAQDDPNKKRISGTKTEASADGVTVSVYTWDCPNPTP